MRYAYDADGRLIRRTTDADDTFGYDSLGRIARETNPLGVFGYTYLGDTAQPTVRSLTAPSAHSDGIGHRIRGKPATDSGVNRPPLVALRRGRWIMRLLRNR